MCYTSACKKWWPLEGMLIYLNMTFKCAHRADAYHRHFLHWVVWNAGLLLMAILRQLVVELLEHKTTDANIRAGTT